MGKVRRARTARYFEIILDTAPMHGAGSILRLELLQEYLVSLSKYRQLQPRLVVS